MFKKFFAFLILVVFAIGIVAFFTEIVPFWLEKETYKKEYSDIVEKWSSEFNIDSSFVYAVIRTESNFNPNAVSDAGAIGLMQIIEDSFDWVSKKLGHAELEFDDMFDPQYSIEYGCFMLGYLYNKYGSYELAAAAYHSGMGEVDGWISDSIIDPESPDIESFLGSSTRHYCQKIMRAYEKYKETEERS